MFNLSLGLLDCGLVALMRLLLEDPFPLGFCRQGLVSSSTGFVILFHTKDFNRPENMSRHPEVRSVPAFKANGSMNKTSKHGLLLGTLRLLELEGTR